jgi:hypothetical protein
MVGASGSIPQRSDTAAANSASRCEVLTEVNSRIVDRTPTPTFTVPSPSGNTQPYPARGTPSRSTRSSTASITGRSWCGDSK